MKFIPNRFGFLKDSKKVLRSELEGKQVLTQFSYFILSIRALYRVSSLIFTEGRIGLNRFS